MSNFIADLYYGRIQPQERSTEQNRLFQKEMKILVANEEILTEKLTDDMKQSFLAYINAWGIVNAESNLDSFMMGFRIGARLIYDTFASTEAPFRDFSENN